MKTKFLSKLEEEAQALEAFHKHLYEDISFDERDIKWYEQVKTILAQKEEMNLRKVYPFPKHQFTQFNFPNFFFSEISFPHQAKITFPDSENIAILTIYSREKIEAIIAKKDDCAMYWESLPNNSRTFSFDDLRPFFIEPAYEHQILVNKENYHEDEIPF